MDSVMGTKIIVLLLLAVIKLVAGLVPMFIFSRVIRMSARVVDTVLAVALCVGAGVLLSTVFIHMIPETRESLDIAADLGYLPDPHYPFAELFMCLGFFLIYGIEVTVHSVLSGSQGGGGGHSHGAPIGDIVARKSSKSSNSSGGMENGAYTVTESDSSGDSSGKSSEGSRSRRNSRSNSSGSSDESGDLGLPKRVTSRSVNRRPSLARSDTSKNAIEKALSKERRILTTIRNVLVVLALSLHSVFEGMAVGLQLTSSDVWKLFVAIALHAVPILFCIGMEMTSSSTKKRHMVFYIVFVALATPVGVTIGLIVTEHVDATSGVQTLVIGILNGMAGGTLFYITFFEVLDKEKLSKGGMSGLLGFCFIFAGFAIMAAVNAMGHNHGLEGHGGHGHSHGHASSRSGQQVHVGGGHGGTGHDHDHEHENHDHNHGEIINDYVDEIERNLAIGHDKFSFPRHNHQHNHPQQQQSHSHQHNHQGHDEQSGHGHDGHEDRSDHSAHHDDHTDHDHSQEYDYLDHDREQVLRDSHEAHDNHEAHETHDHDHHDRDYKDHGHDYEDHDQDHHDHDHHDHDHHDHGESHEEVASIPQQQQQQRPAAPTRRLRRRINSNSVRSSYPIPYQ